MSLLLFQIGNRNIPLQRETDKHNKTSYNKPSLFMPCNNPTSFFFGFPFLPVGSQEEFLPAMKTLLLQVWASIIITASPCIELLLALLTGLIRKQGPLVEVGLNHPCMSCLLCPVLLPRGEQPPWINVYLCLAEGPPQQWAKHQNRTLEGSRHSHCCLALSSAKGKVKPLSRRLRTKGFLPIPK